MVAEGVRTTRIVHKLAQQQGLYMPVTAALHRVLEGELGVDAALDWLMELPARAEVDADLISLR